MFFWGPITCFLFLSIALLLQNTSILHWISRASFSFPERRSSSAFHSFAMEYKYFAIALLVHSKAGPFQSFAIDELRSGTERNGPAKLLQNTSCAKYLYFALELCLVFLLNQKTRIMKLIIFISYNKKYREILEVHKIEITK